MINRTLAILLVALGLGMATNSLLGGFGLRLMRYRIWPTTLNQLLGSDAAALFVIAPLTLATVAFALRVQRVAPLLALGTSVSARTRTRR